MDTNSLIASTGQGGDNAVTPNQRTHETVDERLRRLTKEAISGGGHNKFGPAHHQDSKLGPIPNGIPTESSGPDAVIHRVMREATTRVPNYGR